MKPANGSIFMSMLALSNAGGGNLYNMMPVDLRLVLQRRRRRWSNQAVLQAVDAKRDVEAVRDELRTPGYALVNLRSCYQWPLVRDSDLRLDAGIDNLGNTPAQVSSIIWPNMQCINPRCPMLLFSNQIAGELNGFFKGEE